MGFMFSSVPYCYTCPDQGEIRYIGGLENNLYSVAIHHSLFQFLNFVEQEFKGVLKGPCRPRTLMCVFGQLKNHSIEECLNLRLDICQAGGNVDFH